MSEPWSHANQKPGWRCSREATHDGPCALWPVEPLVRVASYTIPTMNGPVVVPGGDIPASQVEAYFEARDRNTKERP